MMQSVLLTTPTKQASSKEPLVETPVIQENAEGEAQSQGKNISADFSDALDSALTEQNKNKLESEVSDLLIVEADELDNDELDIEFDIEELDLLTTEVEELDVGDVERENVELLVVDKEKRDNNKAEEEKSDNSGADAEQVESSKLDIDRTDSNKVNVEKLEMIAKEIAVTNVDIEKIVPQSADKISTVDAPQIEQINSNKIANNTFIGKQTSQENNISVSESELISKEESLDKKSESQAILMQIENAKKVNTKVIGTDQNIKLKDENGALLSIINNSEDSPLGKEKKLLVATDPSNVTEGDSLKADIKQPVLDRVVNGLVTGKNETTQSLLNSPIDNNSTTTINSHTSRLDKLINTNTQNSHQTMLLQQPLELQAKNAPALLGSRILMMINQGKQEVSIRLDPAELGSMNIKLQIQQDQVQLTIQTQAGLSREIIEQNLPRLREQLNQQGINLGEANIEQQSQQQQKQSQQEKNNVQDNLNSTKKEHLHAASGDQSEWLSSKIPHLAQGIDYYA